MESDTVDEGKDLLELKKCWIPGGNQVEYGSENLVEAIFKNNYHQTVTIEEIVCTFQADKKLRSPKRQITPHTSIPPSRESVTIPIGFTASLALRKGTNYAKLRVAYRVGGGTTKKAIFCNPNTPYMMLDYMRPPPRCFFVSHRDPADTKIAKELDHHLQKIGRCGYVAEYDRRPGDDIWKDKIMPKIEDCIGMIVVWTVECEKKPEEIFKEIRYAKKQGRGIILIKERGTKVPPMLNDSTERVEAERRITSRDLVELVNGIHNARMRGKG